ncbi:MAG: helix-turn-helix transcriptional regulator [Eggerthellaceae bacterium]|nr:helix-turn-helix transcriptional regulator [Eggerthellaceae bacterium]
MAQGFLDALGDGEIVLVRVRRDPETRAYMEKRCSRGAGAKRKSKKEAMRCLQRYVVREVYHALRHPFESPSGSEGAELRAARKKARLTQADAAAAIGCSISAISKYETGKRRFREIGKR